MDLADLVCPFCLGDLFVRRGRDLTCQPCARRYPIVEGIPSFEESVGQEVQATFTGQHQAVAASTPWGRITHSGARLRRTLEAGPIGRRILHALLWHRFRLDGFIQRALASLPPRSAILDLGCGPGDERYARYGDVAGLDASLWVLRHRQATSYRLAVHGDALRLPFREAQFDAVVNRAFYGHIPMERKDALLAGISRVLKPGGIYVVDVESPASGAHRLLQRRPEAYRRFLQSHHGIWGFEEPREALSRLGSAGLEPVRVEKLWGWIWATGSYPEWFDEDAALPPGPFKTWVDACRVLSRRRALQIPADVCLGLAARIETALTPAGRAVEVMVVARKEREAVAPPRRLRRVV